jgi:hypothetical protein
MENFELRQFDIPLLRFSAEDNSRDPEIRITWVNEEKKYLIPLDLQLSAEGLLKWLKHRTIPGNRAYVRNFLSKCGLSLNRPLGIIRCRKACPSMTVTGLQKRDLKAPSRSTICTITDSAAFLV